MTERIYLDWNASAPLRQEARAAAFAACAFLKGVRGQKARVSKCVARAAEV